LSQEQVLKPDIHRDYFTWLYPGSPHPGPRFPSRHSGNPRKTAGFRSRKKYAQYSVGLPKCRRKRHHPMAAKTL